MQAQAYDGYVENGRFYPENVLTRLPGRFRAVLTVVLEEPLKVESGISTPEWLDEFNRLLDESGDEKLRAEDFPRANFTREHLEIKPNSYTFRC